MAEPVYDGIVQERYQGPFGGYYIATDEQREQERLLKNAEGALSRGETEVWQLLSEVNKHQQEGKGGLLYDGDVRDAIDACENAAFFLRKMYIDTKENG